MLGRYCCYYYCCLLHHCCSHLRVIWLLNGGYVADFDYGACQCVAGDGGGCIGGGLGRSIVHQIDGVGLPNSFGVSSYEASRLVPEEPASEHLIPS